MLFTDWSITFGEIAKHPGKLAKDTEGIRLYSKSELDVILGERNMRICQTFSNYYGKEATNRELQLMVYSVKNV